MRSSFVFVTIFRAILALCLIVFLCACNPLQSVYWERLAKSIAQLAPKNLPNPVQSQNGFSYIPIDNTAFLIPEKTWLKSYARRSSDGMVDTIILHATVPDVQPWSQERHYEMYSPGGHHLKVFIEGNDAGAHRDHFHEVPHSRMGPERKFIEEPSDQVAQGLRKFREIWMFYKDEASEAKAIRQWGKDFVEERRRDTGKPMMSIVYYEYIENDRVKYFIYCGGDSVCHLSFPSGHTLMIDIHLHISVLPHAVAMADKISDKLREFEAAGLARKATVAVIPSPPLRP